MKNHVKKLFEQYLYYGATHKWLEKELKISGFLIVQTDKFSTLTVRYNIENGDEFTVTVLEKT